MLFRSTRFLKFSLSGGYYIAMACDEIVAEELTITGSIGVVSSKFNAAELNDKAGVGVDTISRGRYAEVLISLLPSHHRSLMSQNKSNIRSTSTCLLPSYYSPFLFLFLEGSQHLQSVYCRRGRLLCRISKESV